MPRAALYCVAGTIRIQIEGRKNGLIEIEERFELIKAKNPSEAEARVLAKWRGEAIPYLSSQGNLVRWSPIEVTDVFSLFERRVNLSAGTEVFSRFSRRRMTKADQWMVRTSPSGRLTGSVRRRANTRL